MNVEILHIDDCPSWEVAVARTRGALDRLGREDVSVIARALHTPDFFPSDGQTNDLACRVYVTPEGLKGTPTTDQIVEAPRPRMNS